MDNAVARSLSIGGYYTGDLAAPKALRRDADGVVSVDAREIRLRAGASLSGSTVRH